MVRNCVFGVKKWFGLNGVEIDWKIIAMPTRTETREEDRAPTKEDLKLLLNHMSGKGKHIIAKGKPPLF